MITFIVCPFIHVFQTQEILLVVSERQKLRTVGCGRANPESTLWPVTD